MAETLSPPPRSVRGSDALIGQVIAGKYRILARLAAGGMGTVYRAEQQALGREVALKLLHPGNLESVEDSTSSKDDFAVLEKRFSREAAILAKLQHPNIVTVYDYGSVGEPNEEAAGRMLPRFYMAMELLGGETLQKRLSARKLLPWDETVRLFRQIARGLREAHALGVVHRDLKPANVMLVRDRDGEEQVKLLDFGIGKILDGARTAESIPPSSASAPTPHTPDRVDDELTRDGRFIGSPQYMSPEQVSGTAVDERSDIYSLGVMMYRCLAGANPFHRSSVTMIMLAHLNEQPRPLSEVAPHAEVPTWLDALVLRCLAKKKEDRPQSIDEVLRPLTESAHGRPVSRPHAIDLGLPDEPTGHTLSEARPTLSPTPHTQTAMLASQRPPAETPSRRPLVAALVAIGVAVVVLTVLLARRPDPTSQAAGASTPPSATSAPPKPEPKPAPSPSADQLIEEPTPSVLPKATATSTAVAVSPPPKPPPAKSASATPPPMEIQLKR